MSESSPESANSVKTRWKDRRVGSRQLRLSRETELATSRTESANSAIASLSKNDSSFEISFKTPSSETASFWRRTMLASERDCQRWRSFDITPATSNDKTAMRFCFDDVVLFGFEGLTESKLFENAVFKLMSQVSRAIEKFDFCYGNEEKIEFGEMGW